MIQALNHINKTSRTWSALMDDRPLR